MERFSLLSLEDGEEFVCDVLGAYTLVSASKESDPRIQGKLRLGTRALYVDGKSSADPIIKIPFCAISGIGMKEETIVVHTRYVIHLLKNGILAPHVRRETTGAEHHLTLQWEQSTSYFAKLQDLLSLHTLNQSYEPPPVVFDYSWIGSVTEQVLLELPVVKHIPLRSIRGNLVVTQRCLYIGLHESLDGVPLQKVFFSDVSRCARRRLYFQETSIVFHYTVQSRRASAEPSSPKFSFGDEEEDEEEEEEEEEQNGNEQTLLLSFQSEAACNQLWSILAKDTPVPVIKSNTVQAMQEKWLSRHMSTYEYLLSINWAAGRSLNDLSQYPIMPWIIADYTSETLDLEDPATYRNLSKPIGALTETRLQAFKKRKADSNEPYLYGTHYSTPTYVLYYLVRDHPEWMLFLHNGKFDKGNRMFTSVAQCWKNVNTLTNDVKELIPQFFNGDGSFLETATLDLGEIEDESDAGKAEPVPKKVILPKWADNAQDFIQKNREALESEYVSQNIGGWIDLIFGCNARGERADRCDNLFHPLSYGYRGAGAGGGARTAMFSSSSPPSPAEELQIREFGQSPIQIFKAPHPSRAPLAEGANTKRRRKHTRVTGSLQPITKLNSVIVTSPTKLHANLSFGSKESPTTQGHRDPTMFAPVNSSFSLRASLGRSPVQRGSLASGDESLPETLDLRAELEEDAAVLLSREDTTHTAVDTVCASEVEGVMREDAARFTCVSAVDCMRKNATHAVGMRFENRVPDWMQRLMHVAYAELHPPTGSKIERVVKRSSDTCDDSCLNAVFIAGESGQLPIVDTQNGARLRTLQMGVHSLTSLVVDDESVEGSVVGGIENRLLIAGSEDEHVYCFGLDSGRMEERVECGATCGTGASGVPTALSLSAGADRQLAVGSEHGTVALYSVDAGRGMLTHVEPVLMEHQSAVTDVKWGEVGSNLLGTCSGESLLVYDTRSLCGGSVMRHDCDDAYGVVFVGRHSCDAGGMVALLCREQLMMLDMRRVGTPLWKVPAPVAPTGASFASGGSSPLQGFVPSSLLLTPSALFAATEHSVLGYNTVTGAIVAEYEPDTSPIQAVTYVPNTPTNLAVLTHPHRGTVLEYAKCFTEGF